MKRTSTRLRSLIPSRGERPLYSIALIAWLTALSAGALWRSPAPPPPAAGIGAALHIAGVDFPASKTCGHFNVIAQLVIANTGTEELEDIAAGLDLAAADQFGPAFRGIVPGGAPAIVESTAAENPALNPVYDGNGDLFFGGGRLLPAQRLVVRLTFEVNPTAAELPDNLVMQALVRGIRPAGGLVEDRSDSGRSTGHSNPGAPGNTGGADDPTPLGDCWRQARQIAVDNLVFVTAGSDCEMTITPDMLIENYTGRCDTGALPLGGYYRLFHLGKEVTGPLPVKGSIGQQLAFVVRAVNNSCEPVWGNVQPEDKTPPVVTCASEVNGLIKFTADGRRSFRPAAAPDEAADGEVFNYLICTDLDSIYQIDRSWKDPTYRYYTGFPDVEESCGAFRFTGMEETLTEYDCETNDAGEGRQHSARLERVFSFVDESGNPSSCRQVILFYRPYIFLPDCKLTLDLCRYSGAEADLSPRALRSAPYYVTGACDTLLLTDHTCDFTVEYADQFFLGPENCGYKLVRTWTILDWCWRDRDYRDLVGLAGGYQHCPLPPEWYGKKLTFEQHIVVGDDTPPQVSCPAAGKDEDALVFVTGPFDCTATITPPAPVVEGECNDITWEFDLYGDVYDPKRLTTTYQRIGSSVDRMLPQVPAGRYDLIYRVTDACGNVGRSGPCAVVVRDQVNPVAVCNDKLNVSVGGDDLARIEAADVDEGSWDNCGNVTLAVRRTIDATCLDAYVGAIAGGKTFAQLRRVVNAAENRTEYYDGDSLRITLEGVTYYSWWAEVLFFTCCDISADTLDRERIELRVTDAGGNSNTCWLAVRVEDKIPPRCTVRDDNILCTELDFDPTDPVQVAARFGAADRVVTVLDNCGASVSEELVYKPGNCGEGLIERRFTVTDHRGLSSQCVQRITIREVNRYTIHFPGDTSLAQCGGTPTGDVIAHTQACDILAIDRDTARFPASAEECFKWFITYRVINWCEYDGQVLEPTVITRDIDEDQDLGEDTWLDAGFDEAFVKKHLPGESSFFIVKIFSADELGRRQALPVRVLVRADCADGRTQVGYRIWQHRGNGDYEPVCDKAVTGLCANRLTAAQCWTPGFYSYTQVLKVNDQEPPVFTVTTDSLIFCAYGSPETSCDGQVDIGFRLTDACTPGDVELRRVRLFPDGDTTRAVSVDAGVFILSRAGDSYVLRGRLPVGKHRFALQAADGCGNLSGLSIDFEVVDCKSPAPICINGIAIELMPVDTNDDGVVDGGMNTVWATDFIASEVTDCAGEVTYSINRRGETPDRAKTSLTVSCADPLFETLPVEIHAWDANGNHDFCETFFVVEDLRGRCGGAAGQGSISGVVLTEDQQPVDQVQVRLSGQADRTTLTRDDGAFRFDGLEEGYDYSVQASRLDAPLNGVSTFDLIIISKHILGVRDLDSPYKVIAADVNGSGSITTIDLIQLRKLILGQTPNEPNAAYWRFFPAGHSFANPRNPWQGGLPGVISINDLAGEADDAKLVAVKVGDVNNSVTANSLLEASPRDVAGAFRLLVEDARLAPGQTYEVPVTGPQLAAIQGLQGTLRFDRQALELVDITYGLASGQHLGVFADSGLVTLSWNWAAEGSRPGETGSTANGQPSTANHQSERSASQRSEDPDPSGDPVPEGSGLFTLVFRAKTDTRLSQALRFDSTRTPAEAYGANDELLDVVLDFGAGAGADHSGFELYQNQPNPFRGQTLIGFRLPEASEATISIHDVNGRRLQVRTGSFPAGYNEVRLDSRELGAAGLLFYTVETATHTATRRMILVE